MDDVLSEILEAEKLLALFLEFLSLTADGLDKQICQVSDREESEEIHHQPRAETLYRGQTRGRARQFSHISEDGHGGEQRETNRCVKKGCTPGKDHAAHDNHQEIERNEVAFLRACLVDQQRNHHHVTGNL